MMCVCWYICIYMSTHIHRYIFMQKVTCNLWQINDMLYFNLYFHVFSILFVFRCECCMKRIQLIVSRCPARCCSFMMLKYLTGYRLPLTTSSSINTHQNLPPGKHMLTWQVLDWLSSSPYKKIFEKINTFFKINFQLYFSL